MRTENIYIMEHSDLLLILLKSKLKWEIIDTFAGENSANFFLVHQSFSQAMELIDYSIYPNLLALVPIFFSHICDSLGQVSAQRAEYDGLTDVQMLDHLYSTLNYFLLEHLFQLSAMLIAYHKFIYKNTAFDDEFSKLIVDHILKKMSENSLSPEFIDYIYNLMLTVT